MSNQSTPLGSFMLKVATAIHDCVAELKASGRLNEIVEAAELDRDRCEGLPAEVAVTLWASDRSMQGCLPRFSRRADDVRTFLIIEDACKLLRTPEGLAELINRKPPAPKDDEVRLQERGTDG